MGLWRREGLIFVPPYIKVYPNCFARKSRWAGASVGAPKKDAKAEKRLGNSRISCVQCQPFWFFLDYIQNRCRWCTKRRKFEVFIFYQFDIIGITFTGIVVTSSTLLLSVNYQKILISSFSSSSFCLSLYEISCFEFARQTRNHLHRFLPRNSWLPARLFVSITKWWSSWIEFWIWFFFFQTLDIDVMGSTGERNPCQKSAEHSLDMEESRVALMLLKSSETQAGFQYVDTLLVMVIEQWPSVRGIPSIILHIITATNTRFNKRNLPTKN